MKRQSKISVGLLALALAALVLWLIPLKKDEFWVSPISGASLKRTKWLGVYPRESRENTALELWLRANEPKYQPEWTLVWAAFHPLVGRAYSLGERGFPATYRFRGVLDEMIPKMPDEKISNLVSDLRTQARAGQKDSLWKFVTDGD